MNDHFATKGLSLSHTKFFGFQLILSLIYQSKIGITQKNTNIYMEKHFLRIFTWKNPFFLEGKTMRQTLNQFTSSKSITIILKFMPNLRFTKYNNKSTSVCLTVKETPIVFFALHTLIIFL